MRCDAHVHVAGPAEIYPQAASRTYLAPLAPLDRLQHLGAARGISRFVIVQPSFYGHDNSLLLHALDQLGANGRGVAAIDPETATQSELADMHRRGVRGLRVNLYSNHAGAARSFDHLFPANEAIAQSMGWHVEVIASIHTLLICAQQIADARAPVVIDHYGLHQGVSAVSAAGNALREIMQLPHVWVKLSAPYRSHDDPLRIVPGPAWLSLFLETAHARCIWGSDWPWTPPFDEHKGRDSPAPWRKLDYSAMFDSFVTAIGDDGVLNAVLEDNPARLYEFAQTA